MNCTQGNFFIERDKPPTVLDGQPEQIRVGDLAVSVNMGMMKLPGIEQAGIVGPEFMAGGCTGVGEQLYYGTCRLRTRVTWLTDDAHATILRQRATGPALFAVQNPPGFGDRMKYMIRIA